MTPEHYRNVIIGSGEGGKYLAWHLAPSGEPTIVIERRWIGGACTGRSAARLEARDPH